MTTGIYVIENLVNGKRYVGSAVNLRRRWKLHRQTLRRGVHHCKHLQHAWNKYGEQSFCFCQLERGIERERLIEREQAWMDQINPEYNTARIAGSTLGVKASDETRAKISAALMGHKINVGRKHRPETIEKVKVALTGQKRTPEQCARIRASQLGKKMSAEARANMSAAHKGKKRTPEQCANIAAAVRLSHARRMEARNASSNV